MLRAAYPASAPEDERLSRHIDKPLRDIARRCVKSWFDRNGLDRLLSESLGLLAGCELIYAMDTGGRQISSNICRDSVDRDAYGQDLSRRPYVVSLSALNDAGFRGGFLCDTYISRVTQHPCITFMYRVRSGPALLGYIAADFLASG